MIQKIELKNENTMDETELFVHTKTGIIYEVKQYDAFVLVRPVTPNFESLLMRATLEEFEESFEEFLGTKEDLMPFFKGKGTGLRVSLKGSR